jgi:hypothetical protein
LSIEAIRIIEDIIQNPDDLQRKYDFVDECGRKGEIKKNYQKNK